MAKNNKPYALRAGPTPPARRRFTRWHAGCLALGMLLMAAAQWLLPPGQTAHSRPTITRLLAPAVGPAGRPQPAEPARPWGELEYVPIALERPDELFPENYPVLEKPAWFFPNYSKQKLAELFQTSELSDAHKQTLLKAARWPVTRLMADCLFTAVSTDTGSFQYPSTTPATFQVASHLVESGADLDRISQEVYQSYPLARVQLLRHVFNHFHLTHDQRTAYFWLRKRDYTRTGAQTEDSEGLIDHIRAIQGVVVACVFEEAEPNLTRISLRSKSEDVDVNAVAGLFGGGGHRAAAGARVTGSTVAVQRRVLNAIKKALNSAR